MFTGVPLVGNLRTRLLALHVLEAVLPACETSMDDEQMTRVQADVSAYCADVGRQAHSFSFLQVVERLFSLLSDCMWEAPIAQAKHSIQVKERVQELKLQVCSSTPHFTSPFKDINIGCLMDGWLTLQGEAEEEDENLPVQEVSFDPEKAQCCVVENGQGLTHGSGGKGYGLASTGISSGCYQWKVTAVIIEGRMRL